MKFDGTDSIEEVVEYVNGELEKNRTMADIEKNDFHVNERVIAKRLKRKNYFRLGKNFILRGSLINHAATEKQKHNDSIIHSKDDKNNEIDNAQKDDEIKNKTVKQEYNKNLNTTKKRNDKIIDEKQESIKIMAEEKDKTNKSTTKVRKEKIDELIELLEPLKEIVQKYNNNIIGTEEVEKIVLEPPNITEVKQKLFKVDKDILEDWEGFIQDHKQFKVQNLISLAIKEFIEKYK